MPDWHRLRGCWEGVPGARCSRCSPLYSSFSRFHDREGKIAGDSWASAGVEDGWYRTLVGSRSSVAVVRSARTRRWRGGEEGKARLLDLWSAAI
jgi:hypothetical protein